MKLRRWFQFSMRAVLVQLIWVSIAAASLVLYAKPPYFGVNWIAVVGFHVSAGAAIGRLFREPLAGAIIGLILWIVALHFRWWKSLYLFPE